MELSQAIAGRRSVRAYLDRPVPQDTLRRVLELAQMAPSGFNFQPWEAVVLEGEKLAQLSALMKAARPQDPVEYPLVPSGLPQLYKDRRDVTVARRMDAAGIARDDEAGRAAFQARNFEFYGAPTGMLVFVPRLMGLPQWSDVGMWLQTVMLLLRGEGLDSCPLESLSLHGRLIKQFTGVSDESHILFCGMAIGWQDPAAPLNHFDRTRAPLDEVVRFMG